MSTNREKFLHKISTDLRHSILPEATSEHPGAFQGYTFKADAPIDELVESFTRELEALAGHVHVLEDIEDTAQKILEILASHQTTTIITWDDNSLGLTGLTGVLAESGIAIADSTLSANDTERKAQLAEMEQVFVGLTGAHGGLADTGAVALISGPGRGRLASLLPPIHITLLPRNNLYPSLPAFLSTHPQATAEGSNLVFIAGPSRSGDIELTLSMGVHGPGEVHVIIMP